MEVHEVRACLSNDDIARLIDQRLSEQDLIAVQRHLACCEDCLWLVATAAKSCFAERGSLAMSRTADPAVPWLPPQSVGGFHVMHPIGQGGMGQVYLGYDPSLDRHVAIKFMTASAERGAQDRRRFQIEARALARLNHANIVVIHTAGEVDGHAYLVSEFVRGRSLNQLPLPQTWEEALRIGLALCRGLVAVHRSGILHRDIKPSNVMLTADGQVKLVDFGLAKLMDTTLALLSEGYHCASPGPQETAAGQPIPGALEQTAQGTQLGTRPYMPPEVWLGEPATPRSDLYSFGALLYELCTGQRPFPQRAEAELRQAVLTQDAPPLSQFAAQIDPRLAAVVMRCLARDPGWRFPSADDVCDALARIEAQPGSAMVAPRPRWPAWLGRRGVRIGATGALASALILGLLASAGMLKVPIAARRMHASAQFAARGGRSRPHPHTPVSAVRFAATKYKTGHKPTAIALAALHNARFPDVIVGNKASNDIHVFTNRGNGSFALAPIISPATGGGQKGSPYAIYAGPLNKREGIDLAVVNINQKMVQLLHPVGTGSFLPDAVNLVEHVPLSVDAADFNGDGWLDLVVANVGDSSASSISVLLNSGGGGFLTAETSATSPGHRVGTSFVVAEDLNQDGRPDIAAVNSDRSEVIVLFNHFDRVEERQFVLYGRDIHKLGDGKYPIVLAAGDLDNDGVPDLVTANVFGHDVSVLLNPGDGSFRGATSYTIGGEPRFVALGDFNADGLLDIALDDQREHRVVVLLNRGRGHFGQGADVVIGVGATPVPLVAGDLNDDGLDDLVVGNADEDTIMVLLNAAT